MLEIMLVVMIIGLLVASAIYLMGGNVGIAQDVRVKGDMQAMSTQLKIYQVMNGFLPSSSQGLVALVNRPDSEPKPKQWKQLMEKMPVDPFGSEYVYEFPGKKNPKSFDIYSKGQDRIPNTDDDIGNWEK